MCLDHIEVESRNLIEESLIGSKPRAVFGLVVQDLSDGCGCFCHIRELLSIHIIYCKWKEKVAAFGTNTCRFLAHIVRKVALSITEPEAILAVIPNEEEILATILRNMVPCLHPIGTYQ